MGRKEINFQGFCLLFTLVLFKEHDAQNHPSLTQKMSWLVWKLFLTW